MSVHIHKEKEEDLGMLQMQVLWLLERGPTHGYALMKKLNVIKKTKIGQGTLYPTLQKLEGNGYIEVKDTGARGRKIYDITTKGKTIMRRSCDDFVFVFSGIFDEYKCRHCPVKNCSRRRV